MARASQQILSAHKTSLAISVASSSMRRRSSAVPCPDDGDEDGGESECWSVISLPPNKCIRFWLGCVRLDERDKKPATRLALAEIRVALKVPAQPAPRRATGPGESEARDLRRDASLETTPKKIVAEGWILARGRLPRPPTSSSMAPSFVFRPPFLEKTDPISRRRPEPPSTGCPRRF
jgi:hypothetical protein